MKCLVVIAHPLKDSLCKNLGAHVEKSLISCGHQVVVEDLYKDNFSPVLTEAERASYYDVPFDASTVEPYAQRLLEAEALVLVFPTWWFSFPAILKGWFDRVWGPGIAYDHADDYGPIRPRLDNLKQVLAVTTLGAPWWVDRLVLRQPVKKVLKIALLGACARKSKLDFLSLYNSEKLNRQKVDKFYTVIDKTLTKWG